MGTMRLLAPAGGPEQLDMAIHFGADEVYLAGREWGMRSRSDNFDRPQLARAVERAHEAGVAVHLAVNTPVTEMDAASAAASSFDAVFRVMGPLS